MTRNPADDAHDAPQTETEAETETETGRRRRRAEIFGDVLPDRTSDERADGWSDPEAGREVGDEWLRRQVPPHHG